MTIAVALVVILAALAGFIATSPGVPHLAHGRSPLGVMYAYMNDFHKRPEWSPWEKLDRGMKREISGAPSGRGATYYDVLLEGQEQGWRRAHDDHRRTGHWIGISWITNFNHYVIAMLGSIDAILLGRAIYQLFSDYWRSATNPEVRMMNLSIEARIHIPSVSHAAAFSRTAFHSVSAGNRAFMHSLSTAHAQLPTANPRQIDKQ